MKGDIITGINEDVLTWNVNVINMLSGDLPININLQRGGDDVSLRLTEKK